MKIICLIYLKEDSEKDILLKEGIMEIFKYIYIYIRIKPPNSLKIFLNSQKIFKKGPYYNINKDIFINQEDYNIEYN